MDLPLPYIRIEKRSMAAFGPQSTHVCRSRITRLSRSSKSLFLDQTQIVLLVLVQEYVGDSWSVATTNQLSSIIIDEIKVQKGRSSALGMESIAL